MVIMICVGSSCHIKGSYDIVALFQAAVEKYHLENQVVLSGSFCTGRCNREGVTVQIDDEVFTGITRENFEGFFNANVLARLGK